MVTGGSVEVEVVETKVDSVVVVGAAVSVTVELTGVGATEVIVGASGARSARGLARVFELASRLSLAASIRRRAYS